MDSKNKVNSSIYFFIFSGIILIGVILIALTAFVDVKQTYEIIIPEFDNSTHSKEYDLITITLENKNSIFPKRVELQKLYLCVYDNNSSKLLYSTNLETNKAYNSITSDIFDLREKFVDISANSKINIIYSGRISRYEFEKAQEINFNYRVEYRELKEYTAYPYGVDEEVCRGEKSYNLIFPQEK